MSSRPSLRHLRLVGALLAIGVLATACGNGASASSAGSDLSVRIAAPADGATVGTSFIVNLDASVPIGDPSTGEHHVHLCIDGESCDSKYILAYEDQAQVDGLAPGEHTIEATLRNADHSDAGSSDTIAVTVSADGGAGSGTGGATGGGGSGGGYGY